MCSSGQRPPNCTMSVAVAARAALVATSGRRASTSRSRRPGAGCTAPRVRSTRPRRSAHAAARRRASPLVGARQQERRAVRRRPALSRPSRSSASATPRPRSVGDDREPVGRADVAVVVVVARTRSSHLAGRLAVDERDPTRGACLGRRSTRARRGSRRTPAGGIVRVRSRRSVPVRHRRDRRRRARRSAGSTFVHLDLHAGSRRHPRQRAATELPSYAAAVDLDDVKQRDGRRDRPARRPPARRVAPRSTPTPS